MDKLEQKKHNKPFSQKRVSLLFILYDSSNNKCVNVKEYDVYDKMYYNRYKIPTKQQIEEHKLKYKDDKISIHFETKIDEKLSEIKKNISKIDYKIPLFDICTYNLYLVNRDDVLNKSLNEHFRCPTKETIKYTKKIILKSCMFLKHYTSEEFKKVYTSGSNKIKHQYSKKLFGLAQKIESRHFEDTDVDDCEQFVLQIYKKNENLLRDKLEIPKIKMINHTKDDNEISIFQMILKETTVGYKAHRMLEFLNMLNLKILFKTYNNIISYLLDKLNNEITFVKRNDYMQESFYSKPYFSKNEIVENITNKKINEVIINKKTLIKHNMHIAKNKKINLIKYYTFNGSSVMNKYLRDDEKHIKNDHTEKLINVLTKLIHSAPPFNNTTIVYRTIHDDFLENLKIGDTYIEKGFLSTTRNQFYTSEHYSFGNIMLVIEIPTKKAGIALCVETLSMYPEEQEIIFPPLSIFKLTKKESNIKHYYSGKSKYIILKWKYYFVYIGRQHDNLIFEEKNNGHNHQPTNLLKNVSNKYFICESANINFDTLKNYFIKKMLNETEQLFFNINNVEYVVNLEVYNSTNAYIKKYDLYGKYIYKKIYINDTTDGFALYCVHNDNLLFFAEIFNLKKIIQMHVNYPTQFCCVGYSFNDYNKKKDDLMLKMIAQIAYFFNVDNVFIYGSYIPYKISNKSYNLSIICADIYSYIVSKKKRFDNHPNNIITEMFSYEMMDVLKKLSPQLIINSEPKDELYRSYKIFKLFCNDSIMDLLLWLYDYNDELVEILISRFSSLNVYKNNNPFDTDNLKYKFNYCDYLIENNMIKIF